MKVYLSGQNVTTSQEDYYIENSNIDISSEIEFLLSRKFPQMTSETCETYIDRLMNFYKKFRNGCSLRSVLQQRLKNKLKQFEEWCWEPESYAVSQFPSIMLQYKKQNKKQFQKIKRELRKIMNPTISKKRKRTGYK